AEEEEDELPVFRIVLRARDFPLRRAHVGRRGRARPRRGHREAEPRGLGPRALASERRGGEKEHEDGENATQDFLGRGTGRESVALGHARPARRGWRSQRGKTDTRRSFKRRGLVSIRFGLTPVLNRRVSLPRWLCQRRHAGRAWS